MYRPGSAGAIFQPLSSPTTWFSHETSSPAYHPLLWTTPTDLLHWSLAVTAAWSGRDTSLLPQLIARDMLTVQKGAFGLGPTVSGTGNAFRFGHGGSNVGFRSQLWYYPEAGIGAAVMVNSDNSSELIDPERDCLRIRLVRLRAEEGHGDPGRQCNAGEGCRRL